MVKHKCYKQLQAKPDASTRSITFTPLPALVGPMPSPPCFALLNVPSAKHSYSRKSSHSSTHRPASFIIFSHTPCLAHRQNQRCTVFFAPYCAGRFFHFAPLSNIQEIPSTTFLLSTGGLPPFGLLGSSGILSHIKSNCLSARCSTNYACHTHANITTKSVLRKGVLSEFEAEAWQGSEGVEEGEQEAGKNGQKESQELSEVHRGGAEDGVDLVTDQSE